MIALELAPYGISLIANRPGTKETDTVMKTINGGSHEQLRKWLAGIPLGRFANPQDQANVVSFLASDYAPTHHRAGDQSRRRAGDVVWSAGTSLSGRRTPRGEV